MFQDMRIGIIGFGNMGEAILKGLLNQQIVQRSNLFVADISADRILYAKNKYSVNGVDSGGELIKKVDILILCIKPQDLKDLAGKIAKELPQEILIISILAGVTTKRLEAVFKKKCRVIRVMPNMAAMVGSGISAISLGKYAVDEDKGHAVKIFKAVGVTVDVSEELQDAVTAISGSGPAYFFYVVELLIKAGVGMGLTAETSKLLAIKTLQGSGLLFEKMHEEPEFLRKKVTSKGGTTEAAFKVLARRQFDKALISAVQAGAKRAKELSKG